jgi:hypothetical protein
MITTSMTVEDLGVLHSANTLLAPKLHAQYGEPVPRSGRRVVRTTTATAQ